MRRKKLLRRFLLIVLGLFLLMNLSAYMHAYKFTHFSGGNSKTTTELSFGGKLKALFLGIDNPRPGGSLLPSQPYETIFLQSNKKIECWSIRNDSSKGTVVLFHGYGGNKSSLLDKSNAFYNLGYSTFLVDFMGSGGSEGNRTTIGFKEADQVKTVIDYLHSKGENPVYLFGTSMGAVAIMRAIHKLDIQPTGIILECPFGSLYQTTKARFRSMGVPSFPMAGLLVFWGGVQNGFNGFAHNPVNYAKSINCPTLLLYGEKDEKVSRKEMEYIFRNLKGSKTFRSYPNAGHENYLLSYNHEWNEDVEQFLISLNQHLGELF